MELKDIAVVLAMTVQFIGLVALFSRVGYNYGALNANIVKLETQVAKLEESFIPKLDVITRLDEALKNTVKALEDIQHGLSSDIYVRIGNSERQIAEMKAICLERHGKVRS